MVDEIRSKINWIYFNPKNLIGIGTIALENGELLYVKSLGFYTYIITYSKYLDTINKIEKSLKEIF